MEYFDFYLFHNVCEMNNDAYLDDAKYGIYTYLMEQKKNGRIKHLGFSSHGSIAPMLLGMYPEEKKPSACIGCRSCETVCPQNLKISEMMSDFAERTKG